MGGDIRLHENFAPSLLGIGTFTSNEMEEEGTLFPLGTGSCYAQVGFPANSLNGRQGGKTCNCQKTDRKQEG